MRGPGKAMSWGARPPVAGGREPQLLAHQGNLLIWSSMGSQACPPPSPLPTPPISGHTLDSLHPQSATLAALCRAGDLRRCLERPKGTCLFDAISGTDANGGRRNKTAMGRKDFFSVPQSSQSPCTE